MKNSRVKLIALSLAGVLSACTFGTVHQHRYEFHRGFCEAFVHDGLVEYYCCPKCGTYFNIDKAPVKKENGIRLNKYRKATGPVSCIGKDVDIQFGDDFKLEMKENFNTLNKYIEEESVSITAINNVLGDIIYSFNVLSSEISYLMMFADFYNTEESYAFYDDFYNFYVESEYQYYDSLRSIYSSKYKSDFFKDLSDEDILKIIGDEESSEDDKKANELHARMQAIVRDFDFGRLEDIAEGFKEYKTCANEYAKLMGYEDYVDYGYRSMYSRDYKMEDTTVLKDYIEEYIYPAYKANIDNYYEVYDRMNSTSVTEFNYLENCFPRYLSLIEEYINDFIGGKMPGSYKQLLEGGNYFLSSTQNDSTTAYSLSASGKDPIIFFGSEYQDVRTFIHEFGHYNADINSGNNNYDLCETHSQGNETLFYYFLLNKLNKTPVNYDAASLFVYAQLHNILTEIITVYAVNEIEIYAYTHDDFTFDDLQNVWNTYFEELDPELFQNYIGYDTYWEYFLFDSPLYGISYATSGIGSLELFAIACDNINQAKSIYGKLYQIDSTMSFQEGYKQVGLSNVFEEAGYQNIKNAFIK